MKFEEFDALKEDGFLRTGSIPRCDDNLGISGRYSSILLEEGFEELEEFDLSHRSGNLVDG